MTGFSFFFQGVYKLELKIIYLKKKSRQYNVQRMVPQLTNIASIKRNSTLRCELLHGMQEFIIDEMTRVFWASKFVSVHLLDADRICRTPL